jgi:hypothetical protein
MVERIHGLVLLETFGTAPLASSQRPRKLFGKRLVLPELPQHGLVREVGNVLGVVERRRRAGAFIGLFSMAWFTWEDACVNEGYEMYLRIRTRCTRTFEDTEPAKVCERALQFLDGRRACHICLSCASLSFLLYSSHQS